MAPMLSYLPTNVAERLSNCGSSRLINRLGEKNANWQLKALLHQHLPNPSRYDRVPDPQKPHAMCYLADEAQLVDDKLLTSELTALLVVAADTALKAAWQKQKIISVTLITGSRRTVRVSQCILNAETGGIEIRKSPLVSFPNGFRADWNKCFMLLG
ncbi:hypothetical protein BKA60DRAFT_674670 [Fusarium oxysporum]|nr:hypothetical protein BKA60DRAFT_674670 [Fusarium oxysporum]